MSTRFDARRFTLMVVNWLDAISRPDDGSTLFIPRLLLLLLIFNAVRHMVRRSLFVDRARCTRMALLMLLYCSLHAKIANSLRTNISLPRCIIDYAPPSLPFSRRPADHRSATADKYANASRLSPAKNVSTRRT